MTGGKSSILKIATAHQGFPSAYKKGHKYDDACKAVTAMRHLSTAIHNLIFVQARVRKYPWFQLFRSGENLSWADWIPQRWKDFVGGIVTDWGTQMGTHGKIH